jgi:hypothetical protein
LRECVANKKDHHNEYQHNTSAKVDHVHSEHIDSADCVFIPVVTQDKTKDNPENKQWRSDNYQKCWGKYDTSAHHLKDWFEHYLIIEKSQK